MSLSRSQLDEVESAICDLLAQQELGVLATVRGDGSPSASTMYFAADGLTVYCHTLGYTRKYQDLHRNPRVAYTLAQLPDQRQGGGRLELRMIQVSGRAVFLEDPAEIDHALAVCGKRFGWLSDDKRRAGFERDAREGRMVFFRIVPEQALWNDNRVSAAWRVLVNFSPEGHVAELRPYGPAPA